MAFTFNSGTGKTYVIETPKQGAPKKGNVPKVDKKPEVKSESYFAKLAEQIKKNVGNTNEQIASGKAFGKEANEQNFESYKNFQKDVVQNTNFGRAGFGYMRGALPQATRDTERKLYGQDFVDTLDNSKAAKAGEIAGVVTQFAAPYAAAAPRVGKVIGSIPKISKMGTVGQNIAKSVATDIAVGLPLNVNYAVNKENLRGTEALKSIGINTAIDLVTGGVLEAIPVILKSGKRIASKAEFDKLPQIEKDEVLKQIDEISAKTTRPQNIVPQGSNLSSKPQNIESGRTIPKTENVAKKGDLPTVVGNGNMGEIIRDGDYVYKNITRKDGKKTLEAEVYEALKDNDNVLSGKLVDYNGTGKIRTPFSKNIVSIDTIPKEKRASIGKNIVSRDIDGIINAVNDLSVKGYSYSDPLQFAYDNGKLKLFDFSNVYKVEDAIDRNYSDLSTFLRSFGLDGYADVVTNGMRWKGLVEINDLDDIAEGLHLMSPEEVDVVTQVLKSGVKPNNVYYSRNARAVQAKTAVGQTEPIDGIKYVFSDKPLSPSEIEEWELKKIYESSLPTKIAKKGDLGVPDLGADNRLNITNNADMVKQYGAIPKGELPRAREIDVPKATPFGDTQQYARTLQESAIVDDTLSKEIESAVLQGDFAKPTVGNKTVVDDASKTITDKGIDNALDNFKSVLKADKQATSYDIALGNRVLQELQKQGRYDEALDVATDLSQMLSETGRTLQSAKIAKRLSPEGRLMIAAKTAEKISKKTGKKVKLSDETIEQISKAKTEKEIVEANQKAGIELWNQVPANWIDKVNSWRYMAMLFNPKTHVRNIAGNALFVPAREFKNIIGTGLEKAIIKNGDKTKAILNPAKDKELMDFARKDFGNVVSILKNQGKLDDMTRTLDAKIFNTQGLEALRKLNLNLMDIEDTWFMKFAYDGSLAQYMKANNLKSADMVGETLDKARNYAMNESLKATYRDMNSLANLISKGKKSLSEGKYGTAGKIGGIALEGALPFTKTPANILKRGLGYSPANVIRGLNNLRKAFKKGVSATEALDQIASGLSGTAILGLGYLLGSRDIVNGKTNEYGDKSYDYNQMLGIQNYSINFGDGESYTLDWAAPLSMPFFVGVEWSKAGDVTDLATVIDSMTSISDPMINLSMLKGMNDIVTNNFEGIGQIVMKTATGYAGQYNPTLFGQIARSVDKTRRDTTSTNENKTLRSLEKFANKQVAKIPGSSSNLQPYVDLWGREQENGGIAENFLSPGYYNKLNVTDVDREIQNLSKSLDEEKAKSILPTKGEYVFNVDGEEYRMTETEYTQYRKNRGQTSYNELNEMFRTVSYKSLPSEEKANRISKVYSEAHIKAKEEFFRSRNLPISLAWDKSKREKYEVYGEKAGITPEQYQKIMDNMDTDGNGYIKKNEAYDAFKKFDLTKQQGQALIKAVNKKW